MKNFAINSALFVDTDPQLLVIESCSLVGYVWKNQPIFKINKIGLLSLGQQEAEITTHPCSKHSNSVAFNQRSDDGGNKPSHSSRQQEALAKTWGSIKSATKSFKSTTVQAAQRIGIDGREGDRGARKIWDEMEKMFTHADSFYFSPTVDLTNSIPVLGESYNSTNVSWRSANSRFFWNKYLLKELIDLGVTESTFETCGLIYLRLKIFVICRIPKLIPGLSPSFMATSILMLYLSCLMG